MSASDVRRVRGASVGRSSICRSLGVLRLGDVYIYMTIGGAEVSIAPRPVPYPPTVPHTSMKHSRGGNRARDTTHTHIYTMIPAMRLGLAGGAEPARQAWLTYVYYRAPVGAPMARGPTTRIYLDYTPVGTTES